MKQLAMYQTVDREQEVRLAVDDVYNLRHAPLTDLQSERVGFTEIYEGEYYNTTIKGYSVFKVRVTKRKPVKPDNVEREFNSRIKKLSRQEVSFDMDVVLSEVNDDLIRMSDQVEKDILVVFDHENNRFMIDSPRNQAEEVMCFMHKLMPYPIEFEVVMSEPQMMQNLLTQYVVKEDNMPEPFVLDEYTELALPVKMGDKAKPSTVIVKGEPSSCDEVKNHLNHGKRVNKLALDFDGVIFFKIDSTFFISSVAYEEALKYTTGKDTSEEEDLVAHWSVVLPELTRSVNILLEDLYKED